MPITIYELAIARGLPANQSLSGADFERVQLPILGGCEICGATIAAYNAAPAKTGYLRCAEGCIADQGYETTEEAIKDLFND